jgi:hypothetical protein
MVTKKMYLPAGNQTMDIEPVATHSTDQAIVGYIYTVSSSQTLDINGCFTYS